MSFIHENPWLIQELLKISQAQNTPAQPAPKPSADASTQSVQLAKELVQNLYKELSGEFTFTAERENADLSAAHVVNVDELLNFLEFNGVKANGRNLVLKANLFLDQNGKIKPNMVETAKWYVPYPVQGNPNYYLYKDGMIGFLDDLTKRAENNPMLKAVVAKLKVTLSSALPQKVTPHTEAAGDNQTPQVNPQQAGSGQGQGGLSNASPQILAQLSSLRPFNAQYISLSEITTFVDLYTKFANDDDTRRTASDLAKYISTFKMYLGQASPTIPLTNITSSRFKTMLKAPNEATLASNLLYDIVFYAGQMYQTLIVSLQSLAQDPERGKNIDYRGMQQQVVPGGPWQTNLSDLDDLRKVIQREWMAGK